VVPPKVAPLPTAVKPALGHNGGMLPRPRLATLLLALALPPAGPATAGEGPALRFFGGAQEVGGSCLEVRLGGKRFLVDCGSDLRQEGDDGPGCEPPRQPPLPPAAGGVAALFLTHAHADHLGRLPELVAAGFTGPVYATPATAAVARLALYNIVRFDPHPRRFYWSARSQGERRAVALHWRACPGGTAIRRRREEAGPLCALQERLRRQGVDAYPCRSCAEGERDELLRLFRGVPPGQVFRPAPGVEASFHPTRHLPGSAAVLLKDAARGVSLLLSGDLGNDIQLLYRAPDPLPPADVVVVEGTYGAAVRPRPHRPRVEQFRADVAGALAAGRLVWIPALVLDRTQKVLHVLEQGMREGRLPRVPVYVPSPTARAACRLWEELAAGRHHCKDFLPSLAGTALFPPYREELPRAEKLRGPAVLVTASGMMHVGVSADLLPHLLPREDVFLAIVSYQDPATPGGRLLAGQNPLRWGGRSVPVRATWRRYDVFSGHADQQDLLRLLARHRPSRILLNHGEPGALEALAAALRQAGFSRVEVPQAGRQYPLP